jgi:hypothetical protein
LATAPTHLEGVDLRAARRAVENTVREAVHLGVSAFAGMAAQGVKQACYAPQGLEGGAEQRHSAGSAVGNAMSQENELARFADLADEAA